MYEEILERLIKARKQAGLSQGQAAKLIDDLKTMTVSDMESGDTPISLQRFLKMCEIYGISEVWALTGINPNFDTDKFRDMTDKLKQRFNGAHDDILTVVGLLESMK